MTRIRDEFDLVLASVDMIEGEMARGLLEAAGIPSLLHGPDFDVAELGTASHMMLRKADLFVPKGAREAARRVMVAAWGEARVAQHEVRGTDPVG